MKIATINALWVEHAYIIIFPKYFRLGTFKVFPSLAMILHKQK